MEILKRQQTSKAPADWFTGDVWWDVIYAGQEPSRMRANLVRFSPCARTDWHSHAMGQTLHIVSGVALIQSRGGQVIEARPGDTIYTPPGEEHWHGAAPDSFMEHLALWEGLGPDGGPRPCGVTRSPTPNTWGGTSMAISDAARRNHNTPRAFETSMKKLGLDYLDLYLMHQPFGDVYGQWRAMEGLYRDGRTKAIGVSNFYPGRLVDIIDHNDVVPAVNQIEVHPFFQRTADQDLMRERGVVAESWGPFAAGKNNLFTDPVLTAIGEAHGVSVPQVVLRWLIQRGIPVNAKSVSQERMAANLDVFGFELTTEETARIVGLDTGHSLYFDHRDPAMVSALGSRRIA